MIRNLLQSKVLFAVLLVIVTFTAFRLSAELHRRVSIDSQIAQIQKQTADLQVQRDSLSQTISKLSSDQFIEAEAREKLNLVKPGERIVVVTTNGRGTSAQNDKNNRATEWWNYFFEAK